MKRIMSVVGVGIALAVGGCAQMVPSGQIQELESSIANTQGSNFGTFMTEGHNCADNLYHANLHLSNGQRVNGKFMNSASSEISDGMNHANQASSECANAEKALGAYIDEKLSPLEARVARLESFHKEIETAIHLEGIFFAFNKSNLNAESQAYLDTVIMPELQSRSADTQVEIAGYTDSVGSYDYNMGLSESRAQSVHDYLVSKGINDANISAKGFGPDDPVASNDSDMGRAKNRRVELHIFK